MVVSFHSPDNVDAETSSLSFNGWSRDEENFCATVPKDGRSYSPTLFAQTVRVLKKINKPGNMIVSFSDLAERIKVRAGPHGSSTERWSWGLGSFSTCAAGPDLWAWSFLWGPGGGLGRLPASADRERCSFGLKRENKCLTATPPPVSRRPAAAGGGDVCGRLR